MSRATPVCLTNARLVSGRTIASSIRFDDRILGLDQAPDRGDLVIDAGGAYVLPGLVNAHDHLELNHYGTLAFRDRYTSAAEWIEDVEPRLRTDPSLVEARRHAVMDRLLIGALKNLLSGATTVAHHNPVYPALREGFPIRVAWPFAWAHSFYLDDRAREGRAPRREPDVIDACRATPPHVPFILHLGEGTDERSRAELGRLDRAGCLRPNSVLVHGVAVDDDGWRLVVERGAALVWCPASNLRLLGTTADVRALTAASADRPAVALGTDSRISGSADLLDELRVAHATGLAPVDRLLEMVTGWAAAVLRLPDAGRLAPGLPADLIVVPAKGESAGESLLAARRRDLLLVTLDGRPRYSDEAMRPLFERRHEQPARALVDGAAKLLAADLAALVRRASLREPGLTLLD
jgi:cytosine/adenosine deaminase-related metal-dependent hydrolase